MRSFSLQTAPQSIGEIIATGWRLGIAAYTRVFPFTLGLSLLNFLIQLTQSPPAGSAVGVSEPNSESLAAAIKWQDLDWASILTGLAILLLIYLISLILHAALISQMNAVAKNRTQTFAETMYLGFGKALPLLGVTLLFILFTFIGFFLLVIPGIYIMVALYFSGFIMVLKEVSVMGALKESYYLVQGHWWSTFFRLLIISLIILGITVALGIMLGLVGAALSGLLSMPFSPKEMKLTTAIFIFIIQVLFLPIVYGWIMAIYYDLEARH